ncbi:hypothetical protein V1520DRAFT_345886 [Lipomyces starkeyi]|uniref:Uncharacterized protein n=1 Tax=Lipomyces starkeyi NRRL Y-11557 TaxID=675824 RepID=A0A1E3Q036_LIPST|nr:hypothetical protein LIPSTDRAFT_97553 [Lipomyces starkeyi NRRL Y-11557]
MASQPDHTGSQFTSTTHHDTYPAIDPKTKSDQRGRAVLITGASKGIGRATAVSFAKAGATAIVIAARSNLDDVEKDVLAAAEEAGHSPPQVVKLQLDVTDEASISSAVSQTEKQVGRLDVLINNAGYLENWKPVADSDPSEWWLSWEINLRGVYLMTRAFLPLMLKGGQKIIVNVSSIGAHYSRYGASAYQTAKFALLRFTEFVASEYESEGIVTYALHPGGVPTELALGMPEPMHSLLVDRPQLAADTITWLTTERREWLMGRYISSNWDLPELMSKQEEIVNGDKLKMRMVV